MHAARRRDLYLYPLIRLPEIVFPLCSVCSQGALERLICVFCHSSLCGVGMISCLCMCLVCIRCPSGQIKVCPRQSRIDENCSCFRMISPRFWSIGGLARFVAGNGTVDDDEVLLGKKIPKLLGCALEDPLGMANKLNLSRVHAKAGNVSLTEASQKGARVVSIRGRG